ncbi:MAG: ring-opening amidohydrolase [Azospirillaceae bacterium]
MWTVDVHRFDMAGPDDVGPLEHLFDSGAVDPETVCCVIAKTEGNGRVNDYSRPLAHRAFRDCLAAATGRAPGDVDARVAFVMSGGCEGVMTPHAVVFARRPAGSEAAAGDRRLSLGLAATRDLLPEEVGTRTQVDLVAEATRAAVADAGLAGIEDVHYVQVKGPLLTSDRINAARARGREPSIADTLKSLGFSNGAGALGIAVGLGEVAPDWPDGALCGDPGLYTTRGASSAGIELMRCQVVVMGNAPGAGGDCVIAHRRLDDLIDADAVRGALGDTGLSCAGSLAPAERGRVAAVFAKGQVPLDGLLRGRRTTLLTDSDLNTRPARAVLNAVVASVIGDPAAYVSAGWGYHQGPVGGGVVAVIARTGPVA